VNGPPLGRAIVESGFRRNERNRRSRIGQLAYWATPRVGCRAFAARVSAPHGSRVDRSRGRAACERGADPRKINVGCVSFPFNAPGGLATQAGSMEGSEARRWCANSSRGRPAPEATPSWHPDLRSIVLNLIGAGFHNHAWPSVTATATPDRSERNWKCVISGVGVAPTPAREDRCGARCSRVKLQASSGRHLSHSDVNAFTFVPYQHADSARHYEPDY
jgi:hypothetical protein